MSQVIVTPNGNGGLVIIYPSPDCGLSVDEIARKDVSVGQPYLIVDETELPNEMTFFDALEADFSAPMGHGADYGTGSTNAVIGWNEDGSPQLARIEIDARGVERVIYPEETAQ